MLKCESLSVTCALIFITTNTPVSIQGGESMRDLVLPSRTFFCLTTTPLWSESVNWLVSWSDGSVNRAALWKRLYCDIDDVAFCQTLLNMFSSSVSFTFLSVPHHKVYYQSVINIISPVMSSWTWRGLTEPFLFLNLFSQINQFYLYSTNSKVISWHFTCRVLFSVELLVLRLLVILLKNVM